MSSTEDGLLRAIVTEPDDDTHRLVYADWLDDHGEPNRAEFIRAQVQLARDATDSPERRMLAFRARQLLDQHEEKWTAVLEGVASEWTFRRGFVEGVLITAEYLPRLRTAFDRLPLRSLRVVGLASLGPLGSIPDQQRLLRLDVTGTPLTTSALEELARLRPLAGLTELTLSYSLLDDTSVEALCRLRFFRGLSRLAVGGSLMTEAARLALGESLGRAVTFDCEREVDQLYAINDPRFTTGTSPERQVLAEWAGSEWLLAWLDYEGNLLEIEHVPDDLPVDPTEDDAAVAAFLAQRNVTRGPIRTKRFRLDEGSGIRDYYHPNAPSSHYPAQEWPGWLRSVRDWVEMGSFVWDFSPRSDCWLDRTGEVTAT